MYSISVLSEMETACIYEMKRREKNTPVLFFRYEKKDKVCFNT